VSYGIQLYGANLRKTTSVSQIQRLLREQVEKTPPGKWVLGYGWDQERLNERRFPNRHDLDAVISDKPAFITRVCEHIGVANSVALELANITRRTAPPIGGIIDHDQTGEPTGVLRENAMALVLSHVPALVGKELRRATSLAMEKAVSAGLTSVHCIVDDPEHVRTLQSMKLTGELLVRIYVLIPDDWLGSAVQVGISTGFGDEMLRIQGIKVFTDGSLGGRTAALESPYSDSPDAQGVLIHSQDQLNSIVESASRQGFQVAIHAIGDHAIAMALTAIENANERELSPQFNRISYLLTCGCQLVLAASVQSLCIHLDLY
jgi:predicted amidohydrolase YtcJ